MNKTSAVFLDNKLQVILCLKGLEHSCLQAHSLKINFKSVLQKVDLGILIDQPGSSTSVEGCWQHNGINIQSQPEGNCQSWVKVYNEFINLFFCFRCLKFP